MSNGIQCTVSLASCRIEATQVDLTWFSRENGEEISLRSNECYACGTEPSRSSDNALEGLYARANMKVQQSAKKKALLHCIELYSITLLIGLNPRPAGQ